MRFLKTFEFYTDIEIKSGLYRKIVQTDDLFLAFHLMGSSSISHDKLDDFSLFLKELFLNRQISFIQYNNRRVKINVQDVQYWGNHYFNLKSKTSEHYTIHLRNNHSLIFIYSDKPFEVGPYEKQFKYYKDIEKYNL
jgi:plasmid maintenance system killer protein